VLIEDFEFFVSDFGDAEGEVGVFAVCAVAMGTYDGDLVSLLAKNVTFNNVELRRNAHQTT